MVLRQSIDECRWKVRPRGNGSTHLLLRPLRELLEQSAAQRGIAGHRNVDTQIAQRQQFPKEIHAARGMPGHEFLHGLMGDSRQWSMAIAKLRVGRQCRQHPQQRLGRRMRLCRGPSEPRCKGRRVDHGVERPQLNARMCGRRIQRTHVRSVIGRHKEAGADDTFPLKHPVPVLNHRIVHLIASRVGAQAALTWNHLRLDRCRILKPKPLEDGRPIGASSCDRGRPAAADPVGLLTAERHRTRGWQHRLRHGNHARCLVSDREGNRAEVAVDRTRLSQEYQRLIIAAGERTCAGSQLGSHLRLPRLSTSGR